MAVGGKGRTFLLCFAFSVGSCAALASTGNPRPIQYQCPSSNTSGLSLNATPFLVLPLSCDAEGGGPCDPLQWCCGECLRSLIRGGCSPGCCTAWSYDHSTQHCALFADWRAGSVPAPEGIVSGRLPSASPRLPPPPPPRVPAGSQKNIVLLLTDDQDLRLGSMQAMPHTQRILKSAGANLYASHRFSLKR